MKHLLNSTLLLKKIRVFQLNKNKKVALLSIIIRLKKKKRLSLKRIKF